MYLADLFLKKIIKYDITSYNYIYNYLYKQLDINYKDIMWKRCEYVRSPYKSE